MIPSLSFGARLPLRMIADYWVLLMIHLRPWSGLSAKVFEHPATAYGTKVFLFFGFPECRKGSVK
jgi:hypothetical protein